MAERSNAVHPYVPNAAATVKAEMLAAIGASSVDELYADIPEPLRLGRPLDLPEPLASEADLVRHMDGILARNRTARDQLSFLGAGCAQHFVPAVCDEVSSRGEFLTAYSGHPYEEHGRFQAIFEYQSMMAELLEMDAVNVPTYDGFQAAASALRMAARLTGRRRVLLSSHVSADMRSKVVDYLRSDVEVALAPHEPSTGLIDLDGLSGMLDDSIAGVFIENPTYLGLVEPRGEEIARLTHAARAVLVVGVDPISLGVLRPPASYGADIATGDIQTLGVHLQYGGGLGGFIASADDRRMVMEYPSRLYALAPTTVEGEYGFGEILLPERTSFGQREHGKEWAGTAAALWALTAGVYLALMGPRGMVEVGEGIMARARYAMGRLDAIAGVRIPFAPQHHFKEFVVDFGEAGRAVSDINRALLARGIFGGKDLTDEFPELGATALYCVTELHTMADIDRLAVELAEVLS
jgi:glycine dehydrogenase subunit 1